jgi:hypothetical protein
MTSNGQIAVETKEEMRKRNLPSPDPADALVYSFIHMDAQSVDIESRAGESITGDEQGVVIARASVHLSLFVHASRRDERRSVRSIYDHALVLPAG